MKPLMENFIFCAIFDKTFGRIRTNYFYVNAYKKK